MINRECCYLLQVLYSLLLVRTRHAMQESRMAEDKARQVEVSSAVLSDNGTDWITGESEHQPLTPVHDSGSLFRSFARL